MIAVAHISLVNANYVAADETINILVTADSFSPARSRGASHKPDQTQLSEKRPENITKEPKYTGTRQWYGWLDLGSREDKRHYICFDQQENGQFLLHFDRNKNGDLSDDGKAFKNQGSGDGGPGGFASKINVPWHQLADNAPFKGNFDVWLFSNKGGWQQQHRISHYSRTQLSGSVTIAGKEYEAALIDTDYNDGDLTNDGIAIDLNSNGKLDADERPQSKYEIDGKNYEFKVTWSREPAPKHSVPDDVVSQESAPKHPVPALVDQPETAPKYPVPDDAALQEVAELIQEVYEEDFSKAEKPSQKVALARKFLDEGLATIDDPTGQYGLFQAAKGLAVGVGDTGTSVQAVDEIAKLFEIDSLAMKVKVLESVGEATMRAAQRKQLALAANGIIDMAIADDNFDAAKKLASVAVVAARKSRDLRLTRLAVNRVKRIEALHAEYQEVEQAMRVLEDDPTDAEANLKVGRFHCFVKGNWSEGLSLLALGSDQVLKDLAEQEELIESEAPRAQLALGDRWWDLADQQDESVKQRMQERAGYWYAAASPALSGLAKAKVEKRLAELLSSASPSPNYSISLGISFAEAKRLIARLDRLDEERWAELQGKEFIVPANPRNECHTGIIVEKNERYLVVPCPVDKWNTSPHRWTDVDFHGHLGEGKRASNGMPAMQLCYSLDAAPLVSVVDNYIISGSGKLLLAPSDREGGGDFGNNTGSVRVKIIKIVK